MYHVKNGKYTYLSFTQCHKVILMADPKCSLYKAGNVFFLCIHFVNMYRWKNDTWNVNMNS